MSSILEHIATPLQLAALLLFLVAGIARQMTRSGKWPVSPQTTKAIVNRLFWAAMAALTLGVISPVLAPALDRWLNADEIFHGVVLSTSGDPISGATVNVLSIGMATTNPVGQFEMTVPRHRVAKTYRVQVKAAGYQTTETETKTAEDLRNAEFRLHPASQGLVKDWAPQMLVGQFFGLPFVLVTFRVENSTPNLQTIKEVRGTLNGRDGTIALMAMAWTIVNQFGPYSPVFGPFPIASGAKLDLRIVMMPRANLPALMEKLSSLPPYRSRTPCSQAAYGKPAAPLTDDAYALVEAYANEHYAWREGQWQVQLVVSTETEERPFHRSFSLSAAEVEQLRRSFGLMKQCLAVSITAPLGQDGSLTNFLER